MPITYPLAMRNLRQRLTIAGFLAATLAIAITIPIATHREPRYQNRSLSQWLSTFTDMPHENRFSPEFIQAAEATRHIGPKAIPYLLARFKPQSELAKVRNLMAMRFYRMRLIRLGTWTEDYEASRLGAQAVVGFQVLGTNAVSAIPDLFRLATAQTDEEVQIWAIRALGSVGPKAIPELLQIGTNRYAAKRFLALSQLRNSGTNVLSAVPAILESMTDPRDKPFDFGPVLVDIGLAPTSRVQVLVTALRAEKPLTRASAANSLGALGTNAAAAGPTLQALLLDENQVVREQSTNALLNIAPKLLFLKTVP